MAGNSFGTAFRVTTAGESHGPANVVIIDGCPPGILLSEADLGVDLQRRRPGQSHLVTQRNEADIPEILAGVFEGQTTGASIAVLVRNHDQKSRDYDQLRDQYRPGHADATYDAKYGFRDFRGGGRASARETVARVVAGTVAKRLLARAFGGQVLGYVRQIGPISATIPAPEALTLESIEKLADGTPNLVRCPDPSAAAAMVQLIETVRKNCDSVGGVAEFIATHIPAGLGEPVFDKLKADLAKALFSVPAVVGVEYGLGFELSRLRGSAANDALIGRSRDELGHWHYSTRSNHHGGMLGGISTGMPIILRAAVKPTPSLPQAQDSINAQGEPIQVSTRGRHDPCLLPRFIPVGEAMVALVLADHWLRWQSQKRLEKHGG